jgi:cholera toxin transcriptional activator
VVPVADQRQDKNEQGDNQQSGGFQAIDVRLRMGLRRRNRLTLWLRSRHGFIVAPNELLNYGAMPAIPASPLKKIRFGIFEVDFEAGELRKHGVRLRLQEQPFQVLRYLVEHAGEAVTREELRQKLWPADTFVDFDHSLNTAVNKLRETLGDSAASPHYIETLPRRGYRFLASVERIGSTPSLNSSTGEAVHPELEIRLPHRAVPRSLFVLIQAMYLVFYLEALFRLDGVDHAANSFVPSRASFMVVAVTIVTAGIGIVLRCYLMSAIGFDYARLRQNFERLFLPVLLLDELWALSPFLIAPTIGFGAAFAATAALLYVPFSERTLLRMAYPAKANTSAEKAGT